VLYGREHEQAAVERLLDGARQGRSGVLVLRGEPGIGKTALLDHAAGAAGDFRVIRAAGVEYEAELPFAGLHLLLGPVLDRLPGLPGPQRRTLQRAFGLSDAAVGPAAEDRLLAGLAVLTLLAELAEEQPLLCVVDDAQWLDRESSAALLLAARRLQAEGVLLLLAARVGEGDWSAPGLPELRLGALGDAAAGALLDARAAAPGSVLGREARGRVLAEAHGNPLALMELSGDQPSGVSPSGGPLDGRLHLAYHAQVSRMPAATQTVLLVAAAEESGDLTLVLRAAALLGGGPEDLRPAEDSGLVRLDQNQRLVFRHPLLRSAVHRRAPLALRLAVHRALAEALTATGGIGGIGGDGGGDGERAGRRAWHLALAATGTDEEVAAGLERTAEHATLRGGHAGAAAAYERAARLSPDPVEAIRRAARAAEAAAAAGELDLAAGLAERTLRRDPADPLIRAQLLLVQGTDLFRRGSHGNALEVLLRAADLITGSVPGHAARVLILAMHAAWYEGERQLGEVLDRLAGLRLPPSDPAVPLIAYLQGIIGPLLGREPGPTPSAATAMDLARRAGAGQPELVTVCGVTLILGHDEDTARLAPELVAEARAAGALGLLPTLLFFLAESELFHGNRQEALAHGTESLRIAEDTGQSQWAGQMHSFLACLAAVTGDEAAVREAVERSQDAGIAGRPWSQWAMGQLELGLGRAAECLDRLGPLVNGPQRFHVCGLRAVPDLVEAAVRLRRPERAAEPFDYFSRWAGRSGEPWAAALVLRCEALLGDEADAEKRYLAALKLHAEQHRPWDLARTELLYGEWLRRARRKAEARGPLRTALWAFEQLEAEPWAARARTELEASGTAVPQDRVSRPLAGLTPQESQIVRLAAQGLSNRDIAAQLFLSSRTVGYHLYKAYPKLGVGSRGELAGLL
jgi:DNA-binding CsgD family transcriptional regulator